MNASGVTCMTRHLNRVLCGPINPQSLVTIATHARGKTSVKMAVVLGRYIDVDRLTDTPVVYRVLCARVMVLVGIS